MKKVINYIVIGILVVLIGLCVFLLIDKYSVKYKTMICKNSTEYDDYKHTIIVTDKIDSTGKIINNKLEIVNVYKDKEYYNAAKEDALKEKKNVTSNDKKLTFTILEHDGKVEDDEGNEIETWYVTFKNLYEKQEYICTIR